MGKKQAKNNDNQKSEFELSAKEQYVKVFDGSQLRVLTFEHPPNPIEAIEIMFIPGLLTIFPRWEKVLKELNEHYIVHYIESREKSSSKLIRRAPMKIPEIKQDLDNVEKALGLDQRKYITISSSMGGSQVIENLASKGLTPVGSILLSPGVEIIFPKWSIPLLHVLPSFGITLLKPFIRWHLRSKTVDSEKEPQQAKAYIRAVNEADVRKMRKMILKNANRYNGWPLLSKIKDRIILIGASTDKTHKSDFSKRVSEALVNCTYVDLGTNTAAHDTPLVDLTKEFMKELNGSGPKVKERILPHP
ncbi:MAG: hypothetical protein ACTSPM_09855 [Candidatus Heimdallarchaeota archaeon]